jgi:hypothetical protein
MGCPKLLHDPFYGNTSRSCSGSGSFEQDSPTYIVAIEKEEVEPARLLTTQKVILPVRDQFGCEQVEALTQQAS